MEGVKLLVFSNAPKHLQNLIGLKPLRFYDSGITLDGKIIDSFDDEEEGKFQRIFQKEIDFLLKEIGCKNKGKDKMNAELSPQNFPTFSLKIDTSKDTIRGKFMFIPMFLKCGEKEGINIMVISNMENEAYEISKDLEKILEKFFEWIVSILYDYIISLLKIPSLYYWVEN